jgi:hypothetical protein
MKLVTIPSKDRSDLIREHGERIATLTERIDNLRRDIDRIQSSLESRKDRRSSLNIALVGISGGVIASVLIEAFKLLAPRLLK